MPITSSPATAKAGDFICATTKAGAYLEGIVERNRGGVIRYRAAIGGGRRWANHADIAELELHACTCGVPGMTATAAAPAAPTTLDELAAALAALAGLPPVARARAMEALIAPAQVLLAQERRAAIYEATRTAAHAAVAGELGVTVHAVNKAVTAHLRTLRRAA